MILKIVENLWFSRVRNTKTIGNHSIWGIRVFFQRFRNISKRTENVIKKRLQNPSFLVQNWPLGSLWGRTFRFLIDFRMGRKFIIFWYRPGSPKININGLMERLLGRPMRPWGAQTIMFSNTFWASEQLDFLLIRGPLCNFFGRSGSQNGRFLDLGGSPKIVKINF